MNVLPQFSYGMVVIGSLSMEGDGAGVGLLGGRWKGVGRALGGRWEGVGRVLRGRWEGVGRALGGRWEGVGTALGRRWDGVGRALGGRWRVVRVGPGSLIYRQIMKLRRRGRRGEG